MLNFTYLSEIIQEKAKNDELKASFQDGCDKIVGKLTALGYPPESPQGPDEICNAISKMYTERYSEGLAANSQTTGSAKIKYIYHTHTSDCYTEGQCWYSKTSSPYGSGLLYETWSHSACGQGGGSHVIAAGAPGSGGAGGYYHTYRKYHCGKGEGEIERVEITFE